MKMPPPPQKISSYFFPLQMPSSSASSSQGQPMYSVEQIELIRRLRNSGLTKEQVVQAFESFERVEAELGNLYTVPISLSQHLSASAGGPQVRTEALRREWWSQVHWTFRRLAFICKLTVCAYCAVFGCLATVSEWDKPPGCLSAV